MQAESASSRVAVEFADLGEALQQLLRLARAQLDADTAAILLSDSSGLYLDTIAADGLNINVRQRARVEIGHGFAGVIAEQRAPLALDRVGPDNVVNPLLLQAGVHSLLGVPLVDGADLLGVMHVGTKHPRHFTSADIAALQGLGHSVAHALRRHLTVSERSAAAALQRSLLPTVLPHVPGLEMASRYLPAEGQLGGDWYDVFLLPDDRLGLVIGDVIGHGLESAIVMGRMRSALRAYALEFPDPADVLTRLNAKFCHFEPDAMATVLYAVAEPPYAELSISRAGHPAPILLDGSPAMSQDPDLPIGLKVDQPRHSECLRLPPDVPMLMFTDGLVERRSARDTRHNLQALADLGIGSAEDVCARAIRTMFDDAGPEDDAALIVVRRTEVDAD